MERPPNLKEYDLSNVKRQFALLYESMQVNPEVSASRRAQLFLKEVETIAMNPAAELHNAALIYLDEVNKILRLTSNYYTRLIQKKLSANFESDDFPDVLQILLMYALETIYQYLESDYNSPESTDIHSLFAYLSNTLRWKFNYAVFFTRNGVFDPNMINLFKIYKYAVENEFCKEDGYPKDSRFSEEESHFYREAVFMLIRDNRLSSQEVTEENIRACQAKFASLSDKQKSRIRIEVKKFYSLMQTFLASDNRINGAFLENTLSAAENHDLLSFGMDQINPEEYVLKGELEKVILNVIRNKTTRKEYILAFHILHGNKQSISSLARSIGEKESYFVGVKNSLARKLLQALTVYDAELTDIIFDHPRLKRLFELARENNDSRPEDSEG